VDDGDLPAAVLQGVFEGEAGDALAAFPRVHARGDRDGLVVVADRDVVLEGHVQPFQVFPDQHEVDVLVAAARDHRAGRADIGVQLEFLPQPDVDRAKAAADRGGERAFERQLGAPDAGQRVGRQRIAAGGDAGQAALLDVPGERAAKGGEDRHQGVDDLGADAVAGDEGRGNRLHSFSFLSSGRRRCATRRCRPSKTWANIAAPRGGLRIALCRRAFFV
jgi:hypothetical protein